MVRRRLFGRRVDLTPVALAELGLSPDIANRYDDSGGAELELVLNAQGFGRKDAVIDVGAGKGGTLLTFYGYSPRRIAGVELSPLLVEVAASNLRSLRARGVELYCCDAAEFREYGSFSYVYLFNPFPAGTMRQVMARLEGALDDHQYENVTLIYRNPVCHEEVVASGSFALIATYTHSWNPINVYVARARSHPASGGGGV